jgi:3-deoxy-manno-octulosonate cytidylyltransferase (CMP-KDO synthetase)
MSVLGVIPARYAATRLPGKPLIPIAGISLVQRVWAQARQCRCFDDLVVATEDQRILEHVADFGGRAVLTSDQHRSGTDRLGEVAQLEHHDYYVNVQGDEPLVDPLALEALVEQGISAGIQMGTLVKTLDDEAAAEAAGDPNVVKVVRDAKGYALYFSRSQIPYPRVPGQAMNLKHIGVYMYQRETLLKLCGLPPAPAELAESLEQLRALHHGIRILTVDCGYDPVSVDTAEDVIRVEQILARLAH